MLGVTIEQERDEVPITAALLGGGPGQALPPAAVRDGLLGLAALRYTQSNSVVVLRDGAAAGIGAGQQNRVDCVKLAVVKGHDMVATPAPRRARRATDGGDVTPGTT